MGLGKQEIWVTICEGRVVFAVYSSGNIYALFNHWDYVESVE